MADKENKIKVYLGIGMRVPENSENQLMKKNKTKLQLEIEKKGHENNEY